MLERSRLSGKAGGFAAGGDGNDSPPARIGRQWSKAATSGQDTRKAESGYLATVVKCLPRSWCGLGMT